MNKLTTLAFFLFVLFSYCAKESDTASGPYYPKVKSIISNHCLTCHSSTGDWLGRPTAFDTDEQIIHAYTSIKAAIVDPVTIFNKRMPASGTLSTTEIEIIVKWWEKGGKITD